MGHITRFPAILPYYIFYFCMPFYSCIFFHWKAIEANRVCKDSVIEKILIPFFTDGAEMNRCFIGRKFEPYIFTIFSADFLNFRCIYPENRRHDSVASLSVDLSWNKLLFMLMRFIMVLSIVSKPIAHQWLFNII